MPPPAPVHAGVGDALVVGALPPAAPVHAGVGDVLVVGVLPSPSRVHAGVGDGIVGVLPPPYPFRGYACSRVRKKTSGNTRAIVS